MVGTVERHEAFRMPRGLEDPLGVLDSNNIIGRSMEDEKRPAEVPDLRLKVLDAQIFEKLSANGEPSSGEFDLRFAVTLDRGHVHAKAGNDVFRVGRCCDGNHRPYLRQVRGSHQHGGTAQENGRSAARQDRNGLAR